jgi:hypothetical protein
VGAGTVRARRGATILCTIDLPTLLCLRDHPGEIAGHGAVDPELIRALLTDPSTRLYRLIYDPTDGTVIERSTRGYTPDQALRAYIEARDVTCRWPGCTTPAYWCDSEHATPYDQGGETSCANCGLLCRTHHNHKTHRHFGYQRKNPTTGETEWHTPLGFTYHQHGTTYTITGTDPGGYTPRSPVDDPDPPPNDPDPPQDPDP